MNPINLYFREPPETDRLLAGDRYVRPLLRTLIRGKKVSGVKKVFLNLCRGLDELQINYTINKPFDRLKNDEVVIVLGLGKYALQGYCRQNRIIAGIGLMTHPLSWPNLCKEYPIAKYLQHSHWANDIFIPYFGQDICEVWPAGIDTAKWAPVIPRAPYYDFLVYNKIMWNKSQTETGLKKPILRKLETLGYTYAEITYGNYKEADFHKLLKGCRAMIFLCEHESQGFACCEAMAMDIPILAWDQGWWLDPEWSKPGDKAVPATSVPFFNAGCGATFLDYPDFEKKLGAFWEKVQQRCFQPRNYILENLTLKKSAERMLSLVSEVYGPATNKYDK